jgi:iron uptake system component EfeO
MKIPSCRALPRLFVPALTVFLLASLVAACDSDTATPSGSSTATSTRTSAPGWQTVTITLTDAGCAPKDLMLSAGRTTFNVSNTGTAAVTEFEILDGGAIIGEVENIAPGIERSFSITLKAGSFVMYCPGGDNERGTLTVTEGSPTS